MTHIYVSRLTITGSDNGLSPGRRQAIIWTNAEILLIGPLGTNFSEILIEIHTFSFKKMHFNMSPGKWRPFCLGLNVLRSSPDPYSWINIWLTHFNSLQPKDYIECHWLIVAGNGLTSGLVPSHYLNQCQHIVNWNLRNKLQRNLN